jgi:glycosyltransferase involved in cell wall biosynthesis
VRILLFQDYLRSGGTEHHALFLAEAFCQRGHDVTLATFRPGGPIDPVNRRLPYRRISLQPIDSRMSWWAPGWAKTITTLDPDVVILLGRNAHRLGPRLRKQFPAVKLVATLRTGRKLPPAYRRTLREADGVAVNSAYAHNRLEQVFLSEGLHPDKQPAVLLVHNPLLKQADPEFIAHERARFRQHHGIEPEVRILIQVAALIPGKNHRALLQNLAQNPPSRPWKLWIVGTGPNERILKEKARQLGLTERVTFWGFQGNVMPFLAAADVFVTTSVEESLPNAVIEAQAAGLPVVAYSTAGLPECVEREKTGRLVDTADHGEWSFALNEVLGWLEERPSLRADCRAYATSTFAPDRAVEAYLHFFNGLRADK